MHKKALLNFEQGFFVLPLIKKLGTLTTDASRLAAFAHPVGATGLARTYTGSVYATRSAHTRTGILGATTIRCQRQSP